jgi:hypothetical protein
MEKVRKLRLFQANQYVSLDYTRQDVSLYSLEGTQGAGTPQVSSCRLTPPREEPLKLELASFLGAVRHRGPVECSGTEGIRALSLALEIHEQAEKAQAREFDRR